jgi:hypothetical protein
VSYDTADESYISADDMYAGTGGVYNANGGTLKNLGTLTGGFSTTINGEYVIIEMPHKLKLSYVNVKERTNQTTRAPGDGKIYGSNDGFNWIEVASFSDLTYTDTDNVFTTITVNATRAYQKFALVVSKISGATAYLAIGQLRYYGHRENDLVRLPDPTNVLKYPHIAMTGPAQRGYVVSGNNVNSTYPPWKAFDGIFWSSADQLQRWQPHSGYYPIDGGDVTASSAGLTTLADTTTSRGDYIQLETPHKLIITQFKIFSGTGLEIFRVDKVRFLGSNTGGTDWIDLGSGDITLPAYSGTGANYATTATVSNTNAYKYHRLVVRSIDGGGGGDLPVVYQLQFFGTEENSSIPIQIGGGNIDKVANFRVYDKFIGEDQALEIWDAQKDEFGGRKTR